MLTIGIRFFDLELMDRIDLHGAFGVECVCSFGGSAGLIFPVFRAGVVKRGARNEPRGAHHIEHARGKAEQEEYNEPPGRDAEPAIDEPADAGTDHDARNEFAREPEALGVAGCSRRPIRTRTIGRRARLIACVTETFVEPLESRGESSFAGLLLVVLAVIARVAHASDTRGSQRSRHARSLKAARTILT